MDDTISRAKAIEALSTITMYKGSIPYNTAVMRIKQLPSAQPEPCEDAVRREDVQSIAEKSDWFESSDSFNDFMWALYELPSAQPEQRTGKWIEYEQKFMTARPFETIKKHVRECSLCRTKIAGFVGTMRYCPNCGAKMEVTE